MNKYSKLIQSHFISFKEIMINSYKTIGLDEIDAMIIMHLYEQKKHRDDFLSIANLQIVMTLKENELSQRILKLIEKGYINLLIENDGKEKFSLEPTIEKLGMVIEKDKEDPITSNVTIIKKQDTIKELVNYIEKTYQRTLSPFDLEMVNGWLNESFTYEEITNAIFESLKAKKTHLKYADAILISHKKAENREKVESDPELKAVLDQINVRKKY